ncbi:MAG: SET domain-containing protein [Porticoccaceae bacterium]
MSKPRLLSWMNPQLEVRDTDRYGKGVFVADGPIARGEMLFVMGGSILTIADENRLRGVVADKPIEISEHFSIGPRTAAELRCMPQHYVNHSCEPNAGFNGQIFMVAMRSIAADEEITYDYGMVMHASPESTTFFAMECQCGTGQCRGVVTENDWQSADLQRRYDGYFQWFLQEKIRCLNAGKV